MGGHDRGVFQWRTAGINQEDAESDTNLLYAWRTAIRRRAEKDSVLQPKPGVDWVPIDESGKVWGPKAAVDPSVVVPATAQRNLSSAAPGAGDVTPGASYSVRAK